MRTVHALGLVVFALWGGVSCVRVETPREEYSRTRLMMAKDMHGVRLEWASEKDMRYALVYRDPASSDPRWMPYPEYEEVRGTGKIIRLNLDHPRAREFEYRLRTLVGVPRERARDL